MKPITQTMYKMYKMNKLGFDFMGYDFEEPNDLSYHHLIIPKRKHGLETIRNGAILVQNTSHDYLHKIERYDNEIFGLITSEMVDENLKGKLDIENLKKIRDLLLYFEKEYINETTKKGKPIIREEYIRRRIKI